MERTNTIIIFGPDRIFYTHHRLKKKARLISPIFRINVEIDTVHVLYFMSSEQKMWNLKVFKAFNA